MNLLVSALVLSMCVLAATAGEVTLEWKESPVADITDYRLHYGIAPAAYTNVLSVGKTTSGTVGGLVAGVTYYFAATAIGKNGAESVFSNEVQYTVPTDDPAGTINLFDLTQAYDGQPKVVRAETVPVGMPVSITYDDSSIPPTAAGTYRVVASAMVFGGMVTVTNALVVEKATAVVTVGSVSCRYTGAPVRASVSTLPAGLNIVVTYGGSLTVPVEPGTYAVVARVEDSNHTGVGEGQLTIRKLLPPGALRPMVATGG